MAIFSRLAIYTTQPASHQPVSSVNIILLADWPIAVNKVDMGQYQFLHFVQVLCGYWWPTDTGFSVAGADIWRTNWMHNANVMFLFLHLIKY